MCQSHSECLEVGVINSILCVAYCSDSVVEDSFLLSWWLFPSSVGLGDGT